MSHILQLMLWGRYAAEGGAEHHGDQHYSITIDIDTHVADEKYQGKLENLEKLWRLLNWEKWTIPGWCRHFSEVHILK